MSYAHVKQWRKKVLAGIKSAFKSKCGICGYDKCLSALDLHHLDPLAKEFNISSGNKNNWALLCEEAQKCVLLCSNCHREVHQGITAVPEDIFRFDASLAIYALPIPRENTPCKTCGKLKFHKRSYCSTTCFRQDQHDNWSSIDLKELLSQGHSYASIGRLVGLTGAAVKKRAKKLNLVN